MKKFKSGLLIIVDSKASTCFSILLTTFVSSASSYNAREYLTTEVSEKFLFFVNFKPLYMKNYLKIEIN